MTMYSTRAQVGPKGAAEVVFGDGGDKDAFSRLRVSNPTTLFDAQMHYDLNPRLFEDISSGNGAVTHNVNESSASLAISGGGVGVAGLQTYQYFPYNPGKSQLIFQTFTIGAALLASGQTAQFGYFDANNGIFFEMNGTAINFVRRDSTTGSAVDTSVAQSAWNLDTMNGSGPSGKTLDFTKAQILVIDLQFLGVGRVRIGFDIDGQIFYCHEFRNSNNIVGLYMQTATLPIRWRLEETGSTGISAVLGHCASVISEGGAETSRGIPFSAGNTTLITAANGADTHVLSIRTATTFNSIANRITTILEEVNLVNTGTTEVIIKVWYQAPPTSPSFAAVDASDSGMEVSVTGTHAAGTGIVIFSFFVAASVQAKGSGNFAINSRLPIGLNAAADTAVGVLTITASGVGATSPVLGCFNWREIR